MKKIICYLFLIMALFIPINSFAFENTDEQFEEVSEVEKYYKTTTFFNDAKMSTLSINNINSSITEEISKEEYDAYNESNAATNVSASVETTYKKLTSSILSNGSYYRYKAVLTWKNIPKVRSFDTIAIGHYESVKLRGGLQFSQTYCITGGDCNTVSTYYPNTFTTGAAATFRVPTGDLSSLSQTLYFDVQKATTSTVIKQYASGDYAHAIKSINYIDAQKYKVTNSGIIFDSSVENYFDEIQVARAIWTGSW